MSIKRLALFFFVAAVALAVTAALALAGQGMGPGPGVNSYAGGGGGTASIVGTPFKKYPATSGNAEPTGITTQAGDLIVVFAGDQGTPTHSASCSGGTTCVLTPVVAQGSNTAGNSKATALTGLVTVGGALSVTVTGTASSDLGFTVIVVRGISSATPNQSGGANYANNNSPEIVTLTTTVKSSWLIYWLNESNGTFTSWTNSATNGPANAGHVDASGYLLNQSSGVPASLGANITTSDGQSSVVIVLAMPNT